jgi:Ca2+-binding EF-hand superfamily protein
MGGFGSRCEQPQELTEKQYIFILENTTFDREQVDEWYIEFLRECPTGRLRRRQFQNILAQEHGKDEIKRFSKFAFQAFDKDHSGFINYTEFIIAIAALSSGDMISNLGLTFKMYDINNDGSISKRELKKIIKALYKLKGISRFQGEDRPSKRVKLIFEKYDKSKDNRISEKEFIEACLGDPMIRSLLILES